MDILLWQKDPEIQGIRKPLQKQQNRKAMKISLKKIISGVALLVACSGFSSAATIANATFAFVGLGSPTYVGEDLSTATSLTLAPQAMVSDVPQFYSGTSRNDFFTSGTISSGGSIKLPLLPLHLGGLEFLPIFNFSTFGIDSRYTFDVSSAVVNSGGTGTLNLDFFGTFHDSTGNFLQNVGELRIGLTQTGHGAISESGTFAAPPLTTAPEPGTLALVGSTMSWAVTRLRRNVFHERNIAL